MEGLKRHNLLSLKLVFLRFEKYLIDSNKGSVETEVTVAVVVRVNSFPASSRVPTFTRNLFLYYYGAGTTSGSPPCEGRAGALSTSPNRGP